MHSEWRCCFFLSVNVADGYRRKVSTALAGKTTTTREAYAGYLIRIGDSFKFQWSSAPIEGALAKVSPAEGVIEKLTRWGTLGARTPIKRPVVAPHDFFDGLNSFFRYARKYGVMVTMLQPVAKIGLFCRDEWGFEHEDKFKAKFPEVGTSFNIGEVLVTGAADPDTTKLDDLAGMSQITKGIFTGAFARIEGKTISLEGMPVQKPASDDASETESSVSTAGGVEKQTSEGYGFDVDGVAPQPTTQEVEEEKDPASKAREGCYLLLLQHTAERGGTSYELSQKYAREEPEGAVAFFKPSVTVPQWKYNRAKTVLMRHTMSNSDAHRQIKQYYEKWMSFLKEARKMEGTFETLPISDKAFEVKVLFQEFGDGAMSVISKGIREPVNLMDKKVAAVINARNTKKVKFFQDAIDNSQSMPTGILMNTVTDKGDGYYSMFSA